MIRCNFEILQVKSMNEQRKYWDFQNYLNKNDSLIMKMVNEYKLTNFLCLSKAHNFMHTKKHKSGDWINCIRK